MLIFISNTIHWWENKYELWVVNNQRWDWIEGKISFFSFYLFALACETSWKILCRTRNAPSTLVDMNIICVGVETDTQ